MRTSAAWWLRILLAGARVQLSRGRGGNFLLAAVVTPVFYAVVLVLMARYFGRTSELAPFLVVSPALIGVWAGAILTGAEAVADERGSGTFELLIAAPAPTELVVLGRVGTNTLLSLIAIPLVVITGQLLGAQLAIVDVFAAVLALLGLAVSTMAITLIFASTFVLARTTRVFQNVIGFPLYILSGIAFPLALLPDWAQVLSTLVALRWVGELLRAAIRGDSAGVLVPALTAMATLALLYGASGHWLFSRIERAVRANGQVSLGQ